MSWWISNVNFRPVCKDFSEELIVAFPLMERRMKGMQQETQDKVARIAHKPKGNKKGWEQSLRPASKLESYKKIKFFLIVV
jgi:hypothetical protein